MVKQGSFFQRLKERFGSGSVKVESGSAAPRPGNGASDKPGFGKPPVARVEPIRSPLREVAPEGTSLDARSSRKLSDREEAMLALGSHFQELTTLLRGSQARVDDQLGKLVAATGALTQLPTLGQQQLDTLRALSAQMERQNSLGEQMASTITRLPTLLENVVDKHGFYGDAVEFDRQIELAEKYLDEHFLDDDARLVLGANYLFANRPAQCADLMLSAFSRSVRETPAGTLILERAQKLREAGATNSGSGR